MGPKCESCGYHVAAYLVTYHREVEPFAVCWICMADARHGPRPPAVAVLPAQETA
jgi:hypothetical protein